MKQKIRCNLDRDSKAGLFLSFRVMAIATALWGLGGVVLPQTDVLAFPVHLANAPMSDFALTAAAIKSATQSILLNIYEFTEPEIANLLEERIRAGVHVEILQEGQPVGGMKPISREIESQLLQAMRQSNATDQYFEMKTLSKKTPRRFRFDHAKYMVIDGRSLLLSSENFSPTGHPLPGTKGNRGWEVYLEEENLARSFSELFARDTDPTYNDIESVSALFSPGSAGCGHGGGMFCPKPGAGWLSSLLGVDLDSSSISTSMTRAPRSRLPWYNSANYLTVEASAGEEILSPDTSLPGLLGMIRDARSTLDLEQMDFKMEWKGTGGNSPLFDEVVQAAQRGVRIRVLLNDEMAFVVPPPGGENSFMWNAPLPQRINQNQRTVEALNQLAQAQGLPLQAQVANLKAMGVAIIHNKGALVDGNRTLISSINWNENSVTRNREAAVLLTSPDANAYFSGLFEQDWAASSLR